MLFQSITYNLRGTAYFLEPLTGSLLTKEATGEAGVVRPPKERKDNFKYLADPFLLAPRAYNGERTFRVSWWVKPYARLMKWLCGKSFFLARQLCKLPLRCFDNSVDATDYFYTLYPYKFPDQNCLPRAFFAASTSKRFPKHGTIFIGTMLPTVNMHAWIIEDGVQADTGDILWVNFAPVAMIE